MSNPKICKCGNQGKIIDSRQREEFIFRRYQCSCSKRWSTAEMVLSDSQTCEDLNTLLIRKFSTVDRDNVADKLIELAQELLRT